MLGDISPGKLVFSRPPRGEVAVAGPGLGSISGLRQGHWTDWSHSARGVNAPLTLGPMAPRCEHDPPTFSTAKWL